MAYFILITTTMDKKYLQFGILIVLASAFVLIASNINSERSCVMCPFSGLNAFDRSDKHTGYEQATFAAGCFWGIESAFRKVEGVIDTRVGYTGGETKQPTYKQVCSNKTGHAEAVEVIFDPNQVSYSQLVRVFFNIHNPTTRNRQGPDVGSQYRSAIFYHNEVQKAAAEMIKHEMDESGIFKTPVVTEITKASVFYPAEDYHQRYYEKLGIKSCNTGTH